MIIFGRFVIRNSQTLKTNHITWRIDFFGRRKGKSRGSWVGDLLVFEVIEFRRKSPLVMFVVSGGFWYSGERHGEVHVCF